MSGSETRDLFDFLGVGTREDSYTTLLSYLFKSKEDWARAYFEGALGNAPPAGPVDIKSRLQLRHQGSRKSDIPDLVFVFGKPATDIWLIEAKIKSGESSDQLRRYQQEVVRSRILDKLGFEGMDPGQVKWRYLYLTLEGQEPSGSTKFEPIEYEPLRRVFLEVEPQLPKDILPAYECLRGRLLEYYDARNVVLRGDSSLNKTPFEEYLSNIQGLIDRTAKFYWLTKLISEESSLRSTFGKTSQGKPFCQLRHKHWQGQYYEDSKVSLRDCFDVHLELQLSDKNVSFQLHFETNPYMSNLKNKVRSAEFERHRKRCKDFANELTRCKEESWGRLDSTGWTLTKQHANQRATGGNYKLAGDVGDFRQWVRDRTKRIIPLIECAGKRAKLWK